MDDENKYKKALETIQEILESGSDSIKMSRLKLRLQSVFPELKENEDEKIKRCICDVVRKYGVEFATGTITKEQMLAWLEKQGESIKIKKGKNYVCTKTHKYADLEWAEGVKYYSPEDYSLVNQGCTCYCPKYSKEEHNNFFREVKYDGRLEKQGEQKSTNTPEWNELTWKDINTLEGIINNVHSEFRNGIGEESFGKEVLERFRNTKDDSKVDSCEQKSEWSESNRDTLDWIGNK